MSGERFVAEIKTAAALHMDPWPVHSGPVHHYGVFPDASLLNTAPAADEDSTPDPGTSELHIVPNFARLLEGRAGGG